jgi:spermidine synthase
VGEFNPYLEVILYRNQFQLATVDALYSDGDRYIPALAAVNKIKDALPSIRHVLVLGAGLGSMVSVLRRKGCDPYITLVEKDKVVLGLAMEFLEEGSEKITPVCNDAMAFMANNKTKFDFVFVDIFIGREVPDFVCSSTFLRQCRDSLNSGGYLAFNYIVNDKQQWEDVKKRFAEIFPSSSIQSISINRILLGRFAAKL